MLPIVGRGFDADVGIIHMKLGLIAIPNEKSETVTKELMKVVVERKIAHKIVAYAADNTNLNFGGSKRNGVNNVWRRLQTELDRQVFRIRFSCHISHNDVDAGCESLEINFESLAVVIFEHFRIHTLRCKTLKNQCNEMNVEYHSMESHYGTH